MVNNKKTCLIMRVITEYDYIYNVINYDYITSGSSDADYLRSSNRL